MLNKLTKAQIADAIERLRDDGDYYGDFGKQFISNSDVGALLSNPREFRISRPDNQAFAKGRYFHQSILEPEKVRDWEFVDSYSRNTNVYKRAVEDSGKEVLLLEKEKKEMDYLVNVMMTNFELYEQIYLNDNVFEVPGVQQFNGVWWKGKADIISKDCIIDLKTTSNNKEFRFSAKKYNYDSQCYIYQNIFGKPLVFYAIDKKSAQVGIYESSDAFVRGGEEKVERALEVYEQFFGENATDDLNSYIIRETL